MLRCGVLVAACTHTRGLSGYTVGAHTWAEDPPEDCRAGRQDVMVLLAAVAFVNAVPAPFAWAWESASAHMHTMTHASIHQQLR